MPDFNRYFSCDNPDEYDLEQRSRQPEILWMEEVMTSVQVSRRIEIGRGNIHWVELLLDREISNAISCAVTDGS